MNKTAFSEKCRILSEMWLFHREEAQNHEAWKDFFDYNDVALPLAYMIDQDIAIVSGDGVAEELIDQTYTMLCEYVNVDPEGWYQNLADVFTASEQPPIDKDDDE